MIEFDTDTKKAIDRFISSNFKSFSFEALLRLLHEEDHYIAKEKTQLLINLMTESGVITGTEYVTVKCKLVGTQQKKNKRCKVYILSPNYKKINWCN